MNDNKNKPVLIEKIKRFLEIPSIASPAAAQKILDSIPRLSLDDLCTTLVTLRSRHASLKKIVQEEQRFNQMEIAKLRLEKLLPNQSHA